MWPGQMERVSGFIAKVKSVICIKGRIDADIDGLDEFEMRLQTCLMG